MKHNATTALKRHTIHDRLPKNKKQENTFYSFFPFHKIRFILLIFTRNATKVSKLLPHTPYIEN